MGERLFSPRSLARVCEAVEWEDELRFWKDGSSNHEQYMKAMAVLWERWMRGWELMDFFKAVQDAGSQNFASGILRVFETLPQRIQQLKGFYEGLWAGANPKPAARAYDWETPPGAVVDSYGAVGTALQMLLLNLQGIVCVKKEE